MKEFFDNEIWKPAGIIHGIDFSASYEASNRGRVRSIDRVVIDKRGRKINRKGIIRKPNTDFEGYLQVSLSYHAKPYNVKVHQVIMSAFNPNPNPEIYTDINHIDEDILNNNVENLEWTTHKENINHGTRNERVSKKLSVKIVQLDFNGNLIRVWDSIKEAAQKMGVLLTCISDCIMKKRQYTCSGCIWLKLSEYNNMTQEEVKKEIEERLNKANK